MRSLSLICLLSFLTAGFVFAGEDTPDAPPSKVLVRERTVYVPYEKLKETFEKEGRGVFLPYEEFIKLWNAGQPKEKPPEEVKPPADAVIAGGNYTGTASENAVRFEVTYKVRALGKNWSELLLPLKNVAIETATISDPTAVFAPKGDGYVLVLPKPGEYTLTLAFSVRIDLKPGQRRIEFGIPPTAVSRLEITIPEKDLRVDVSPKMAATVATSEGNSTKVLAFVGNASQVAVTWMPPSGKTEKGKAIVIATQNAAVKLGERILHIDTAINYRIESNEEDTFRVKMPTDMRALSVTGNREIRDWSEKDGVLTVQLHAPVKDTFGLALRFERILEKTPEKLDITFPSALEALREDGFITVSHDPGLRLRVESSTGLSQIDARELPEGMRAANLLAGFRYVAHPLALSLKIDTILPQIQSSVKSVAIVGIEEDVLTGWVDFSISKVGIFTAKLKFASRWEVASVGDPQTIEDFQTAVVGNEKILTVNLKNKAIGEFKLPFKLTSPGRAAPGELTLETIQILDTKQDAGVFGVSAPKAFKLTTGARDKMNSANVQELVKTGLLAQLPQDFELPLAYTYTAQPASVKIGIERRQTEIRVHGQHTIIVTESGLEMRHRLGYFIVYAGTDKLAFSMPSALDDKIVDIKCNGFKEKRKVSEANGRSKWEIVLQEKTLDLVVVDFLYKDSLKGLEPEKPQDILIPDIRAEDVSSQTGEIVVQKESALEIKPETVNLTRLDKVPAEMRASAGAANLYLAYGYTQGERSLTLKLTRHVAVEVSSTIIDLMRATFVVSGEKQLTVNLEMYIENARGEQYLALALPKNAAVRGAAVNGIGVSPLKREADGGTLFKLASGTAPFWVRIVYSAPIESAPVKMGAFGGIEIATPEVLGAPGVSAPPVNKIEADVYLPEDYAYFSFGGTLHRRETWDAKSNTLSWVEQAVAAPDQPVIAQGELPGLPSVSGLNDLFNAMGKQYRFQTLAPRGSVSLSYCDRKLFTLIDVLIFIAVFAAGWLLVRRMKFSPLWVCAGFIFVPMCWHWLCSSDFREIPTSAYAAGVTLAGVFILLKLAAMYKTWRDDTIARAPDPFLEDGPSSSPPPAPAAPSTPEEPPKPAEPIAPVAPPDVSASKPSNSTEAPSSSNESSSPTQNGGAK